MGKEIVLAQFYVNHDRNFGRTHMHPHINTAIMLPVI